MFDNFKELLSVMQDGLNSSTHLRQTLSEIRKVKFGFTNKPQPKKYPVCLDAGAQILSHYQTKWAELHAGAELASAEADKLDRLVTHIHTQVTDRVVATSDLYQCLQTLPKLASSVDECIEQLSSIEGLLSVVEEELQRFEDLVDRQKLHEKKMEQHKCLAKYKDTKLDALELQRATLASESAVRQKERERQQISLLHANAEKSAREFHRDLQLYRDKGFVPTPNEPNESQSLTLEQVELDNDREDLENFLDS